MMTLIGAHIAILQTLIKTYHKNTFRRTILLKPLTVRYDSTPF